MTGTFDVVVVGGGIIGLAVASMLAVQDDDRRLRITLVDAGPRPLPRANDDIALRVSSISAIR